MGLTRLPGWQGALDRFLTAHRETRFQYGVWDCCLFACDAIEVMTGVDVAAQFRGRYHSRTTSANFGRSRSSGSLVLLPI